MNDYLPHILMLGVGLVLFAVGMLSIWLEERKEKRNSHEPKR